MASTWMSPDGGRRRTAAVIPARRRGRPMPPERDGRWEGAPTGGRGQRDLLLWIRPLMDGCRRRRRCRPRGRMKPPTKPPRVRVARRAHVRIPDRGDRGENRTPHDDRAARRRRPARVHGTPGNRKRRTSQSGRTPQRGGGKRRGHPSRNHRRTPHEPSGRGDLRDHPRRSTNRRSHRSSHQRRARGRRREVRGHERRAPSGRRRGAETSQNLQARGE